MKINRFLSFIAAGALALTTALTGAISLPGGMAIAAYTGVAILKGSVNVGDTADGTTPAGTGIVITKNGTVTLTAKPQGSAGGTNYWYKWTPDETNGLFLNTADGTTSMTIFNNGNMTGGTISVELYTVAADGTKTATGITSDVAVDVAPFDSSTTFAILDPGKAAAATEKDFDGSANWAIAALGESNTTVKLATVAGGAATAVPAMDATVSKVEWTSSAPSIISVTGTAETGTLLANKEGSATITAKIKLSQDKGKTWSDIGTASIIVKVLGAPNSMKITKTGETAEVVYATPFTLSQDEPSVSLTASSLNDVINTSAFPVAQSFEWYSPNPLVTISGSGANAIITLSGIPDANVTVTVVATNQADYISSAENSGNAPSGTIKKTIIIAPGEFSTSIITEDVPTSVAVNATESFSTYLNNSGLNTEAADADAVNADGKLFYEITSKDEKILKILSRNTIAATSSTSLGKLVKVQGIAAGQTKVTIKVTYQKGTTKSTVSKELTINVGGGAPAEPKLAFSSSNYNVAAGNTVSAVATPTGMTGGTLTYASSNTAVATVSASGVVTGVSTGTATLTATYKLDSKTYTATATVTVTAPSGTVRVVLDKSTYSVVEGSTVKATATAMTGTTPILISPVYSIANTSIATVNPSTGLITGVKPGTTTLTVTAGTSVVTAAVTVTSSSPEPTPEPTPTPTPEPETPAVPEFDYSDGTFELSSNGEATYLGSDKKTGVATVPRFVSYTSGGKTYVYKVTAIGNKAFFKSKFTKIKVGSNIESIGYKAIAKCKNLEKVAFEDASNIDDIDDTAFKKTKDGCILKQKNGNKFDSDLKSWIEKTFKQLIIK